MRHTIIGFFNSSREAEQAAERLRSGGFDDQDVDVSISHSDSYASSTSSTTSDMGGQSTPYSVSDESRYGEDRYSESKSRDTLNEDKIRDRKDDNDESFGDSIGRFFRNLFDSKDDAERYANVGRKSSIVSVYAESADQAERARDILDECGAFDVDDNMQEDQGSSRGSYDNTTNTSDALNSASSYESDQTDRSRSEFAARTSEYDEQRNTLNPDGTTDRSIPVIEENMNVGKREVETGGVRLRSRIFERPVEENLRLREERVRVERVPTDRPATEADFGTFREGEVEITETSEVPIVNKEARVVEEVRLSKDVEQREETVRDTVRKTDVEIEKLDEENLKSRKGRKKM